MIMLAWAIHSNNDRGIAVSNDIESDEADFSIKLIPMISVNFIAPFFVTLFIARELKYISAYAYNQFENMKNLPIYISAILAGIFFLFAVVSNPIKIKLNNKEILFSGLFFKKTMHWTELNPPELGSSFRSSSVDVVVSSKISKDQFYIHSYLYGKAAGKMWDVFYKIYTKNKS